MYLIIAQNHKVATYNFIHLMDKNEIKYKYASYLKHNGLLRLMKYRVGLIFWMFINIGFYKWAHSFNL